MTQQSFSLIPFPASNLPEITLTGTISRQNDFLAVSYILAGELNPIVLPTISARPSRRDELWKATCFEFFLAIKDQPQYWEFNLSPSGDWNVYRMDAYRRVGFRQEESIQWLPFEAKRAGVEPGRNEPEAFVLNASIDLNPLFRPDQHVEVGITAVIQTKDGGESYWALAHPAPQADFHLRESFTLALAEQTHLSKQSAPGD